MTHTFNVRGIVLRSLLAATLPMLSACGKAANPSAAFSDTAQTMTADVSAKKPYDKAVSLAIEGYNYTNRYIDWFSVNGNGGGNLSVSSPTSGGGGTVCCTAYRPGTQNNTVTVRWQSDACYFRERSFTSGEVSRNLHASYREKKVIVKDDIPPDAKYMEVHFYPDGNIEAQVTRTASPPRLMLTKSREDKSDYPRCPNDEKPAN